MKHVKLLYVLLTVLLLQLTAHRLYSQTYPVRVQVAIREPLSVVLSAFYTGSRPKMSVTLLNTDLQQPVLDVKLQLVVRSGNNQWVSNMRGTEPILHLDRGMPLRLEGEQDLGVYFAGLPLRSMNPQQPGTLPDDYYQFCFQVVHAYTGAALSAPVVSNSFNTDCCSYSAFVGRADAPLLNFPMDKDVLPYRQPQSVTFNWTPRHLSVPFAMINTKYILRVVKITDTGISPEAAFMSSPPFIQEEISQGTTFRLDALSRQLDPGYKYAWQVQAVWKEGAEDPVLFVNNGYSNIQVFEVQDNCNPPQQVAATIESGRVSLVWENDPRVFEYLVEYRLAEKGKWFSTKVTEPRAMLYDVSPGKNYEYRVSCYCMPGVKTAGDLRGFTVPPTDIAKGGKCQVLPDIKIENRKPAEQLTVGETIMAGGFPVKLMEVSGNGSSLTGAGYVTVPFLGYNRLKVRFANISVNTDGQLIKGVIETTYDPTEGQIVNVGEVKDAFSDLATVVNDLAKMSIDKDYQAIKQMADEIRRQAEEELPKELKEKLQNAAQNLESAKQEYDKAKKAYEEAQTPEEKARAKKEMETAKEKFEQAKKEVDTAIKEKETFVKGVADLLVKAVKALKKDYDQQRDALKQAAAEKKKAFDEYAARARKELGSSSTPATGAGTSGAAIIVATGKLTLTDTDNSDFTRLGRAARQAEIGVGKTTAVNILDRDITGKQYYSLFTTMFKVNGKGVITFINEQRAAGVNDTAMITTLKEKLDELLIQLLDK
ncbi:fibronectin type III domain-containing protein [Chitinophaga qingshengii]|uniref:Fibronectin type-III domain-containing protein n=1 Tax=Chitinophaga qingshengii TaxID=1569794 RepID=A0ABR7TS00_9BACT|nr:fibronectin type III domain-containing protein [Chitinophaga qingshengii]MBC9932778.1 hypothetical protein [Chitinophaga qingshengii]